MNEEDKHFIKRYEELLDKGYCDCNEMNCIDNNSPRRILNIVNNLQSKIDKANELIKNKLSTETYQHLKNLYDDIDSVEEVWEDYEFEDLLDILKEDK